MIDTVAAYVLHLEVAGGRFGRLYIDDVWIGIVSLQGLDDFAAGLKYPFIVVAADVSYGQLDLLPLNLRLQ